jgi:hypothetical protein
VHGRGSGLTWIGRSSHRCCSNSAISDDALEDVDESLGFGHNRNEAMAGPSVSARNPSSLHVRRTAPLQFTRGRQREGSAEFATRARREPTGLPAGVSLIERDVRLRVASASALRAPADRSRRLRRTAFALAGQPESHAYECRRERRLVTQIFTSWNQLVSWLRQIQGLRRAA